MPLDHVLWLGGGCGSGKSTIARELAHRLDLQLYPVDAHGYDHLARKTGRKAPPPAANNMDAQWLDPTPEVLASWFLSGGEESFPLVVEDLEAMAGGPLVLAEGPSLFPELVFPHLASDRHGLWLLPTEQFRQWALQRRLASMPPTSDREQAFRKRLARDQILDGTISRQAAARALTMLEVDGTRDEAEMAEAVAEHFAVLIACGPRARDGAERSRIRRAENAAMHANLTAWWAHTGTQHMPEPPRYRVACECFELGCRARVEMSVIEFGEVLANPAGLVLAPGHIRDDS